jgi:hypothetical protein
MEVSYACRKKNMVKCCTHVRKIFSSYSLGEIIEEEEKGGLRNRKKSLK